MKTVLSALELKTDYGIYHMEETAGNTTQQPGQQSVRPSPWWRLFPTFQLPEDTFESFHCKSRSVLEGDYMSEQLHKGRAWCY